MHCIQSIVYRFDLLEPMFEQSPRLLVFEDLDVGQGEGSGAVPTDVDDELFEAAGNEDVGGVEAVREVELGEDVQLEGLGFG